MTFKSIDIFIISDIYRCMLSLFKNPFSFKIILRDIQIGGWGSNMNCYGIQTLLFKNILNPQLALIHRHSNNKLKIRNDLDSTIPQCQSFSCFHYSENTRVWRWVLELYNFVSFDMKSNVTPLNNDLSVESCQILRKLLHLVCVRKLKKLVASAHQAVSLGEKDHHWNQGKALEI